MITFPPTFSCPCIRPKLVMPETDRWFGASTPRDAAWPPTGRLHIVGTEALCETIDFFYFYWLLHF